MAITIRVRAKTDPEQFRVIAVSDDGSSIVCDCDGFSDGICSHIDAVLVAHERAMVHPDDLQFIDSAAAIVGTRIVIPRDWKGSWRKNLRWRGLSGRGNVTRRVRDHSKPLVCFTGTLDRPRAELIAEAEHGGWETVNSPSPFTDVLVAADPLGNSSKLKAARKHGTPIVTREEWSILMTDGVLPS
jgi:hypothetical protein